MPNPNATQITPPRVSIIDPQTGYVSREWYRWFYSLYNVVGAGTGIIPISGGGTGISTTPTDGQLLIGDGSGYRLNTLTPGTAIGVVNNAGVITINNTGVTSFSAGSTGLTPNTTTTGAVTLAGTLDVDNGGTGADNATDARANLSAAKSGDNSDITSLSGVTGSIATPTYVDFNTAPTFADQMGRLGWNNTDQTLNLGMDYGVVQQIGQETYARVTNITGVTIPNGSVVGFAGATADAISVAPYLADGAQSTLYVLGVMTHELPDSGERGYCTTWGFVRGLDTSGFSVGDILYASPFVAGALVNFKPTAPNNVIPVAACIASDALDGVVFVRPTVTQMQYYGVFAKTVDTTPALADTAYPITFDLTRITNGIVIGGTTSQLIVPESGLYQFNATLQFISSSAVDKNIWVWYRANGTDIPSSARIVTVSTNNAYTPIALNEAVSLAAGEYVELMYAANSTNVTIDAVAATAFAPASPAVVIEVNQVQQ